MSEENITQLKKAMETIKELGIPEHLQDTALKHLLSKHELSNTNVAVPGLPVSPPHTRQSLRNFVEPLHMKGAVAEIPTLLYWAKENDSREEVDEKNLVELYRLAGLRPPRDISQSFRDLSSKKYLRLEAVDGKRGFFRLSRTGEDFVLHDILNKE